MAPTIKSISFPDKIRSYTKASYPILYIKTHEETRVIKDILDAFKETKNPVIIYSWDAHNLLNKFNRDKNVWEQIKSNETGLMQIINYCKKLGTDKERSIILFKDFHPYIEQPGHVRAIRNAVEELKGKGNMFIFISPVMKIPVELEKDIQILDYHLPDELHLGKVLDSVVNAIKEKYPNEPEHSAITVDIRQAAIEAAKGMTHAESHDAYSLSIVENKSFNNNFVLSVFDEKVKQVKRNGLLQYLKPDVTFANIGGMEGLKKWTRSRAKAYSAEARKYGLPYPKGMLLCGIPGCGKTMLAKATANEFGFPLFQLDIGGLFGKHVGETEENFRKVIEMVDGIGRCILFIDEIEKALNRDAVSGKGDTGTSSRAFASLLTWLSDHITPVFVIGTSNDHTKLPTEFTRKGRFDELFWIDLPTEPERREIFSVILSRFNREPSKFKLDELSKETEGFTGAEIENIIVAAMFSRFNQDGKDFNTTNLLDEINVTQPLSKMASADIETMREKAKGKLRVATDSGIASLGDTPRASRKLDLA